MLGHEKCKRRSATGMLLRVDVASPCSHERQPNRYRRRFPPELELPRVCTPCPSTTLLINRFILTTRRNYGLAIPVFKCAKELLVKIKLVRTLFSSPSAYPQTAHDHSPSVFAGRIGESGTLDSAHRIGNLIGSLYDTDKGLLD